MSYSRFAIYYVPPDGPLADFGAAWLGWDIARARRCPGPDLPGLRDITMTPGKYGFHATLKPPFRLAAGRTREDLARSVSELAATLPAAACDGLHLATLNGFLALTPRGPADDLGRIAAACVAQLDGFRAPPEAAELERRRKAGLTPRQDALLARWGYPFVMDAFRFHLTLSGRLPEADLAAWREIARAHLPALPAPFVLDRIALCGERADGRFEVLHRYALAG